MVATNCGCFAFDDKSRKNFSRCATGIEAESVWVMKKLLAAAALTALSVLPLTANAATTILETKSNGGATVAGATNGNESEFAFIWGSAPSSGWVKLSTENRFDLIFESYIPQGANEVTGLVILNADGTRYTNETNLCDNANVLAEIRGACATMAGELSPATATYYPDKGNNVPIMTLDAGTYYIGFYEDSAPASGFATLRTVEVPLPAGGLLLLTALGGAAMVRRRRSRS